ncbi:MAG TPA: beta-ketoacyl-ACP synthase III [Candidatus Limnocylindria bacterium]|nr:beta-ketoacyl-ACP synthase III [Candidatus Limnocylindria bacterium]
MNARILGLGHYTPERVVTNDDLSRVMDTSDEWIQQRTGIRERRFVTSDAGPADLAVPAARDALAAAGVRAADVDLVLLATLSPDFDCPASAAVLQRRLGIAGMPAMDVRNQCSGFIYALATADAFIRSGRARYVLVCGAETHSTGLDQTTAGREVAVIFGDGAGAAVLGPEPDARKGILSTHLHSEGKYAEKLMVEAPASRHWPRLTEEMLDEPGSRLWPRMEGRYVFKHAVTRFPEVVQEALAANGYTAADLDVFIPHQANLRISEFVAGVLELPPEKVFNNIQRYGNTTAASIPIALHEACEAGLVRPGALVCLGAFGAGFTWASALIRW